MPMDRRSVVSPDDPRLTPTGREDVAGVDQIVERLAAKPDERLDSLVAVLQFVGEAREALQKAGYRGGSSAA